MSAFCRCMLCKYWAWLTFVQGWLDELIFQEDHMPRTLKATSGRNGPWVW